MESLKGVEADFGQISKLMSEERLLVARFLASLRALVQKQSPSIQVSPSSLPIRRVTQAYIDQTGHLVVTFEGERVKLMDLSELENRELLLTVAGGIVHKLQELAIQSPIEEPVEPEPVQVEEVPSPQLSVSEPAPEPVPGISAEVPVGLADAPSTEVPSEASREAVKEDALQMSEAPKLSMNEEAKIGEIEVETLAYLEELGNEVFEHSPVSMYFDDWMVNLRQIILSFESNGVIGVDEEFTDECAGIFRGIEGELANRLMQEAELETSSKTLAENRQLLGQIDEGYQAQTKEFVVKGKSALDFLIRNVQHLEEELAEIQRIKTSYLHPLRKLAKDKRQADTTEKLVAAKKRLALAVQSALVVPGKVDDAEFGDLAAKRKSALDFLAKEVKDIEEELAQIEKNKANPVKKQQMRWETTQKLIAAKKHLELAKQGSGAEQQRLQEEYEKQKQATVGKVESLEKEIAQKTTDGSVEARKAATQALAEAVRALIQRKTAPQLAGMQSKGD